MAEKEKIRIVYGALKDANLDEAILKLESINVLKAVASSPNKMVVPNESQKLKLIQVKQFSNFANLNKK